MRNGDTFDLFGHEMQVMLRKETLVERNGKMVDMFRYDLQCTCCSYPKNLVMEVTDYDLDNMINSVCKCDG